jgi:serralysin
MCVACAAAGKAAGGTGCADAAPTNDGASGGTTDAPQPGSGGAAYESAGADTVAGSASTSSTLSIDSSVRGYVNAAGDQDWYRVDLVAGQQYTFALNGFGTGAIADPYLRLFNASGVEVAHDDDSGPLGGARLTVTASASGTYYVSAGGFASGTGQYMLTMNDGVRPFIPVVAVKDAADFLTNTYWELNGSRDRHFASSTITVNLDGLEPERAALARTSFRLWSDVANLTFVETHGGADITLDDAAAGAYASSTITAGGLIASSTINVETTWYGGSDAIDSYTLQTFIHEIGHAIGLGHAGGYNGSASYGVDNSYANDTWQMSVMSYMAQSNYGSASYRFVMTPMMADVMAVQEMYGAANTRNGDSVYGFGSTAGAIYDFASFTSAPALTIYDAGGADTLNASGYGQNQTIDLRPGAFSNIGGLTGNIGIYLTAVIENAVGGSGNDSIVGNDADNRLKGGAGNDSIDGGAGTDSAVFAGARAAYTVTSLGGSSVRVAGPDGTDTLTNVELLVFDDQTVAWNSVGQADLDAMSLHLSASSVIPGGSTTVSYTVLNSGSAAALASSVGIYLSADAAFGAGDTLLATRATPALNAGMSFSDSFALTLPTAGSWYVFAVADYNGAIAEGNEANNASYGGSVNVTAALTMTGSNGNDTFTSGPGNDTINGRSGDDTVVFSHGLGDYTVRELGSKILLSGPDGSDTLTGIEHLRFANGTVNVNDGDPLFDTLYYMRNNLDVFEAGANAREHYRTSGWKEGRDPNPYFDTDLYVAAHRADIAKSGMSPLDYFHNVGWKLGDDPSFNFDTKAYLVHNPDVAAGGVDPLAHFLQFGQAEGRQAYASMGASKLVGGFDAEYYMFHNPDVAGSGVDPLWHYNTFGWHEGRNPNAFFDTAGYLGHYADVKAGGVNPLWHYENFGWKEGRDPSAAFDTNGYLAANPDVAAGHVNPLDHYLLNGIYEGRTPINDALWNT